MKYPRQVDGFLQIERTKYTRMHINWNTNLINYWCMDPALHTYRRETTISMYNIYVESTLDRNQGPATK